MWLNTNQAAKYLAVSRSTFYRWIKQGKIKPSAIDLNGLNKFKSEDLDKVYGGKK